MAPARIPARTLILGQLAIATSALIILAFSPPSRGPMILVPLLPGGGDAAIVRATQADARLVGAGPLPQSFVIWGDRARIVPAMLRHGVLVLAAPFAGCGKSPEAVA